MFERRYRAKPCLDSDHLRSAIVYTHNNPVRAGLCKELGGYAWTSHDIYCGTPHQMHSARPVVLTAVDLFAAQPNPDPQQFSRDYMRYAEWRRACDDLIAIDPTSIRPPRPPTGFGDLCWSAYGVRSSPITVRPATESWIDLRDFVRRAIQDIAPGLTVELIRTCGSSRQIAHIRRQVCERCCEAGYCGIALARHLGVSESYVSRVKSDVILRRAAAIKSEPREVA